MRNSRRIAAWTAPDPFGRPAPARPDARSGRVCCPGRDVGRSGRLAARGRPGSLRGGTRGAAGWAARLSLALPLLAGCYVYVPVRPGEVEAGRPVRAALTERGAAQVVPVFGPGVREVVGLAVEPADSAISILVESYFSGAQGGWVGAVEPLRLPADAIAGLEQRRLSVVRSALLGAAFVGGAVAAARWLFGGDRAFLPDESSDEPGPQELRWPARWHGPGAPGRAFGTRGVPLLWR